MDSKIYQDISRYCGLLTPSTTLQPTSVSRPQKQTYIRRPQKQTSISRPQKQTSIRRPQQQTSIRKPQPSQPSRPQGLSFGGFSSFGSPFVRYSPGSVPRVNHRAQFMNKILYFHKKTKCLPFGLKRPEK